ncbi:9872_t:CDS:2 [Dentiscutata heterogama]|uniref:9872_t:CDS:1 n=1 Tax=Dentiscutata heterogama TaxID=1316150 RepID=A0ACA9KXT5_9GLOM|nr:9872_t:CDS:2 [Dentiscutata heterogama]
MAGILEKPNRVIENQKYFQAHVNQPLWLRGSPARRVFVSLYFGMVGVGLLGSTYMMFAKLIPGKK